MAAMVCEMLRTGTDAFVQQNADASEPLLARDKDVDRLRDELTADLLSAMTDNPDSVEECLKLIFRAVDRTCWRPCQERWRVCRDSR